MANVTQSPKLSVPTVHLGGTHITNLMELNADALGALRKALVELGHASPHARDFVLDASGEQAFYKAQREHEARVQKLRDVQKELETICEGIMAQEPA